MNLILTFSSLLLIISLTQMNQGCNTTTSDNNDKQTVNDVEVTEDVDLSNNKELTENKELTIGCMDFKHFSEEVIINSQEAYVNFLNFRAPHPDCADYSLPPIDFTNSTLLGYKTTSSGCNEPEYKRMVECDSESKTCIFQVSVKPNGRCEKGWASMNWMVVNKITDEFNISFEMKIQRN